MNYCGVLLQVRIFKISLVGEKYNCKTIRIIFLRFFSFVVARHQTTTENYYILVPILLITQTKRRGKNGRKERKQGILAEQIPGLQRNVMVTIFLLEAEVPFSYFGQEQPQSLLMQLNTQRLLEGFRKR